MSGAPDAFEVVACALRPGASFAQLAAMAAFVVFAARLARR